QAGDTLGSRMAAAFERTLGEAARALLIGSDCPAMTPRYLRHAERALRDGAGAVLGPCEDGGYALIGLRRANERLFDGVTWGGSAVMAETRTRLSALGWT